MSSFYQSIIGIISKPSEKRKDEEIDLILNWFVSLFRKKSAVFGDISTEVIKDIIKNCSFETKNTNEIIIQQGEIGECFYINLRGKVSVYINYKKYEDSDKADDNGDEDAKNFFQANTSDAPKIEDKVATSSQAALGQTDVVTSEKEAKKIRDRLGNYVTTLSMFNIFKCKTEKSITKGYLIFDIKKVLVLVSEKWHLLATKHEARQL
jgi:hypothetical protein